MPKDPPRPVRAVVMITYADNSSMLVDVKDPSVAEVSEVLIGAQSSNFTGIVTAREGRELVVIVRPSTEEPYLVSTYPTKSPEVPHA